MTLDPDLQKRVETYYLHALKVYQSSAMAVLNDSGQMVASRSHRR